MTGEALPPCLACGTCCFSQLATFVRVSGSDHARLAERADDLTVFIGNRCYMKLHDGHCAALVLDVALRRFVCSAYDSRPTVCRALERGSPACQGEIQAKGERPSAQLSALGARRPH